MALFPARRQSQDPAALTAGLLLRLGFATLAIVVPTTASFSRRIIFVLLPFGATLILIAAAIGFAKGSAAKSGLRRLLGGLRSPIGIAAIVLIVWGVLSLSWAPFTVDAAQRLFKFIVTILLSALGVAFLPERMRLSSLYLLPVGIALAAAVTFGIALSGPRISDSPETDAFTLERASITLVVLIWPALDALSSRSRWASAGALAAIVVAAALAAQSILSLAAFGVGAVAFGFGRQDPRRTGMVLAVSTFVLFLLAPFLPAIIKPIAKAVSSGPQPDWVRSVFAWGDIIRHDLPRLLTGRGLETVRHGVITGYLPPETPRSILFVVWYELGFVGVTATAFCVSRGFQTAWRAGVTTSPFLIGAVTTALTLAVFGQNFEQLWWVSLLGVAAICFTGVINGQHRTTRPAARLVLDLAPPRRPTL